MMRLIVILFCLGMIGCGGTLSKQQDVKREPMGENLQDPDGADRKQRDAGQETEQEKRPLLCAMTSLYLGMGAPDRSAIRAFLHAEHDPEGALVEAHTRRLFWNARLVKLIGDLEGHPELHNEAVDPIFIKPDDFAFAMLLDNWEVAGIHATIPPEKRMGGESQPPPPPLINVRGVWKVNLTPKPLLAAETQEIAREVEKYADVLQRTAERIITGEIDTMDQVRASLEKAPKFAESQYMPPLVLSLPDDSKE